MDGGTLKTQKTQKKTFRGFLIQGRPPPLPLTQASPNLPPPETWFSEEAQGFLPRGFLFLSFSYLPKPPPFFRSTGAQEPRSSTEAQEQKGRSSTEAQEQHRSTEAQKHRSSTEAQKPRKHAWVEPQGSCCEGPFRTGRGGRHPVAGAPRQQGCRSARRHM